MDKLSTKTIRVVFMGTPDFAVPGLSALLADPAFEIVGVFTQPDRPVGRKQIITPSPIKKLATSHNITVFQPDKIKSEAETIAQLKPDFIVVIAYGQIIPASILALPTYGGINVHGSLLPRYRGAACLSAPILNGDKETGLTIMQMEAGLDTGPIFTHAKIALEDNENLASLHDRLSQLSAKILPATLKDIASGRLQSQAQDNDLASYVPTLKKEDGHIDWQKKAIDIKRMVLAFNPWPGTFSQLEKTNILKILEVDQEILLENSHRPGELFRHKNGLAVQSGQDSLVILKLQIAGGLPLTAKDFLAGNSNLVGTILS